MVNCYHCLTGKTGEKKNETLKSHDHDDAFRTGQKSTLAEGTECQNCVFFCVHYELKLQFFNVVNNYRH